MKKYIPEDMGYFFFDPYFHCFPAPMLSGPLWAQGPWVPGVPPGSPLIPWVPLDQKKKVPGPLGLPWVLEFPQEPLGSPLCPLALPGFLGSLAPGSSWWAPTVLVTQGSPKPNSSPGPSLGSWVPGSYGPIWAREAPVLQWTQAGFGCPDTKECTTGPQGSQGSPLGPWLPLGPHGPSAKEHEF